MHSISFEDLRRDLIRAIRKHRSQERLSRELGFSFNQVHRWEQGKTRILWNDFRKLCEACRLPLREALREAVREPVDPAEPAKIIALLGGKKDRAVFAKLMGTSRFTVSRWISGESEPSLEEVLKAIHYGNTLLRAFLEKLVGVERLPSFLAHARTEEEEIRFSRDYPWISAILSTFGMKDAPLASDPALEAWIAEKVRVPRAQVASALALMRERGLIVERKGKWEAAIDSANPSVMAAVARDLIAYWLRAAAIGVEENYPNPRSMASFSVMPISAGAVEKIRAKYREFWKEVAIIVNEDRENPSEALLAFAASLCDFRDISALPPTPRR